MSNTGFPFRFDISYMYAVYSLFKIEVNIRQMETGCVCRTMLARAVSPWKQGYGSG